MALTDPLGTGKIPGRLASAANRQHVTVSYGRQVGRTRTTGGARATQRSLGQRASGQKIPKASSGKPTKPTGAVKPAQAAQAAVSPAQAAVNAQIDPQLLALNQQGTAYDAQSQQRQQAIQGLTLALIKQLQGNPAAIGGYYDSAINQTAGLANQSAQLLAAANPNAGIQADLSAIGAPAAQQQQVAGNLNNVFAGGAAALFGTRGVLPGTQLATDKAAAQTQALGETNVAAAQGQQNLGKALQEDELFRQNLSNQRAGVMAKEPGLLAAANQQELVNSQNEQKMAQDARQQSLVNSQNAQRLAQNNRIINSRIGQGNKRLAQGNQRLTQGQQRLAQGQQRINLTKLQNDRQWQATLKRLGISEASLRLRATKSEAKRRSGGFTPKQIQEYKGMATTLADRGRRGFSVDDKGHFIGLGNIKGATYHPPLTYNDAVREALREGIPLGIVVSQLNRTYPTSYRVTKRGLKQSGRQ